MVIKVPKPGMKRIGVSPILRRWTRQPGESPEQYRRRLDAQTTQEEPRPPFEGEAPRSVPDRTL